MIVISKKSKGFTLMELMIVVAIIGIISAIAFPSYDKYTKKSRRADAIAALQLIADREVRFYNTNKFVYTNSLAALNLNTVSEKGYYNLSVSTGAAPPTFTATATAVPGKAAENDTGCTVMTIDSIGAKEPNGIPSTEKNCW